MGDLKRKKPKDDIKACYVVDIGEEKEVIIEHGNVSSDEQIIERLRVYIQKFYEIQEEKLEQENQTKKKEGE